MTRKIPPPPPVTPMVTHRGRSCRPLNRFAVCDSGCFSVAVLLVLASACGWPLEAQDFPANECYQVTLSVDIGWATSAVWTEDGKALLVVDVLKNQVLKLSPGGKITAGLPKRCPPVASAPSQIWAAAGGYLIEDEENDELIRLNSILEPWAAIRIKGRVIGGGRKARNDDLRLMAIYDWAPMGDGILAFGDLKVRGDTWARAFLYCDLDGITPQQVFYRIATKAQVRNHYVRNMPYFATLKDAGYILFMDARPGIVEVRIGVDGVRELQHFPQDFESGPRLETRTEWLKAGWEARQATAFYKILETSKMPAGLYAWKTHLFLLGKYAASKNGETAWWLIKLDPHDGMEISRVRLPTEAAHLIIVPGDFWALIEKGPVQGIGEWHAPYMETSSMVLVPAAWLEDPSSGRLDAELRAHCVEMSP